VSNFNESNTVEAFVRDLLCGAQPLAGRIAAAQRNRVFAKNPVSTVSTEQPMFHEQNTVDNFIRNLLWGAQPPARRVAVTAPETRFFSKTWFLWSPLERAMPHRKILTSTRMGLNQQSPRPQTELIA